MYQPGEQDLTSIERTVGVMPIRVRVESDGAGGDSQYTRVSFFDVSQRRNAGTIEFRGAVEASDLVHALQFAAGALQLLNQGAGGLFKEFDPQGYTAMSVAELKAELKERELPTNGAHKVLVARLRADDQESFGIEEH
jgi:hypothetical protein